MTGTGAEQPAVSVRDVSKRFKLHRDRRTSLKERFVKRSGGRYDEFWALRDITLDVAPGSTYGLIGQNGSGKSTLLKLMAGIHRPTSGVVTHRGRVSALLELGAGFHPELSGRDNIQLNGSILGLSRRQIAVALDAIVAFSGIEPQFIDSPVKVYSSGMYVRLGFSIAVNLDPEILIIDEIIAVGDEEFQRRCFDHLAELRRRGVTIVFVSHSLPLVQQLCDRAAWLEHGRLVAEGPVQEVVDAYLARVNAAEQARGGTPADASTGAGRRGSREVEITGVDLLGPDAEEPRTTHVTGERLTIRIRYVAHGRVDRPVFGVGLHSESGAHLAGPNSMHGGITIDAVEGAGHVDYTLDELPLLPGTYLVSAAVVDATLLHVYDYRDRAYSLTVRPGSAAEQQGLVLLAARWQQPVAERGKQEAQPAPSISSVAVPVDEPVEPTGTAGAPLAAAGGSGVISAPGRR